jgi:signal transduction histidine kinase
MIVARIRDAIADTRNIARGLSPVALESTGLMVALQELAENSARLFLIDGSTDRSVERYKNPLWCRNCNVTCANRT